jgi:putative transcriptional regulator
MSAMLSTDSDLSSPVLLVAMPQVLDPFFHRSVVLLVRHEEEGSVGFIVNRPTDIRVREILKGMELEWQGRDEAVAHFGGPVQPQLGTVLFGTETAGGPLAALEAEGVAEVLPGLGITQHVGDLSQLAAEPPDRFRLLLGYAGWGAGQLVEEILRNDWLTAPATSDLIFAPDPERIWDAALRSVGIDPANLPSWVPGATPEESAN